MSKLDELIQKLCPNGVEYKSTTELSTGAFWLMPSTPHYIEKGIPYITTKNVKNGKISFEDVSYISEEDYIEMSRNRSIQSGDLLITMIGTIGETAFVEGFTEFYGQNLYLVRLNDKIINPKFYYYYFETQKEKLVSKKNPSSQGYIKAGSVNDLRIPVPPLEVQEEIVRILDNFTELTVELTVELTAELTARKKQYEYYRDILLESNKFKKIKLKDLFDIKNGYTPSKAKSEYWEHGTLPWFRLEDINNKGRILYDSYQHITPKALKGKGLFSANSIIISTSATIGEYALIKVPFLCNQRFTCLTVKDKYKREYNIKFLNHYCPMLSRYCKEHLNKGNFASVDMTKFGNFEFPIISLEEQQRIVDILDKFDAYYNDLTQGIPAEISARQKQYEYYREKLLTFKNINEE